MQFEVLKQKFAKWHWNKYLIIDITKMTAISFHW